MIHQRYEGATKSCAHRLGQLARFWRPTISVLEKAVNQGENDQHEEVRDGEEAETSGTYCARVVDGSARASGGIPMRVPVRCPH